MSNIDTLRFNQLIPSALIFYYKCDTIIVYLLKGRAVVDKQQEKQKFLKLLKDFAATLGSFISVDDKWTVRGFVDVYKNVYTISCDTKIVSKILELHIFPRFLKFAETNGFKLELAACQNWYPDMTLVSKDNPEIKFAVDLKTTYRDEEYEGFCNGFTLGSHGEYFSNRTSTKNIQYPYSSYLGHYCLGIIYSRTELEKFEETKIYTLDQIDKIPAVISKFIFFAEEKWKIASDKGGSGNTANIGSIQKISDILSGNGVFSKAGEDLFDDYWINFGKLRTTDKNNKTKIISSFSDYLEYRHLPARLNNPKASKRKR